MQQEISSAQLKVVIDSLGAEIQSIKDLSGLEYIWSAEKEIWGRHAPVLFPIVGKLKNNIYLFDEKEFTLSQHGFARDMAFSLIKENISSCVFRLCSSAETNKVYPFDFIFEVGYSVERNKLTCTYKVNNPSNKPLWYSVGGHPGFNCPLREEENFEDYYLEFENNSLDQTTLKDGLISGHKTLQLIDKRIYLSQTLFDNDALVFEGNQINKIKLCSKKSPAQIVMECKNWPYFGIWSKKGNARFICLEPWYGIADTVNTTQEMTKKKGMMNLDGGCEFDCSYSIELS